MQREGAGRVALILALILALVLAVLLVRHHRLEQERDAALRAVTEQAEPLERELAQLERDIARAQREGEQTVRTAFYAVGYQLSEKSDIALALRHAEEYDFTPVFVLDPSAGNYRALISALRDETCEIVLTSEPFDERALSDRPELTGTAAADSGAFLLARSDDTPERLDRIAEAGFTCVVRHADSAENALLDNGLVSVSYSRIKSSGFSVGSRMQEAGENAQTLLIVFDLSALHKGDLTEKSITDTLAEIFADRDSGTVQYGTVSEGAAAMKAAAEAHALSRAELERSIAGQQQRIDEIRAELDAIYAQWNKEDHH